VDRLVVHHDAVRKQRSGEHSSAPYTSIFTFSVSRRRAVSSCKPCSVYRNRCVRMSPAPMRGEQQAEGRIRRRHRITGPA
jgi:hypothetical protein